MGRPLEMRREGSFWEDLGSSGAKVIVKRRTGESLLPNPPALAPDKMTSKSREDVEGVWGGTEQAAQSLSSLGRSPRARREAGD